MSPGRTAVPEEIQDLVAEAGDVLLQLLQRDGERERTNFGILDERFNC